MYHKIISGQSYRLRPVIINDAEFIFMLRSNQELSRFLQDGAKTLKEQKNWQLNQCNNNFDHYFIVERIGKDAQGTIALYNYSEVNNSAEWGRWILKPGSLAAAESAYLIYEYGFNIIGLDYIYSLTNKSNTQAISFHDRAGIPRRRESDQILSINGERRKCPVIEHGCFKDEWSVHNKKLREIREQSSRLLLRFD